MILKTNSMEQKDYFENTLETISVYGFIVILIILILGLI
jgi:hypothetical protein